MHIRNAILNILLLAAYDILTLSYLSYLKKKYKSLIDLWNSLLNAVHICHNILKGAKTCKFVHRWTQ